MSTGIGCSLAPALSAPTAAIERVVQLTDFRNCQTNVNIGIFFDGTNNNTYRDSPSLGHSNIARLSDAYPEDETLGIYPIYIPGVGTPFPAIGEKGESDLGKAFAIGCEQRVLFGLLSIFDALHRRAFADKPFFEADEIKALCCNRGNLLSGDQTALARIGEHSGLLRPSLFGVGERTEILKRQAGRLAMKLPHSSPLTIAACYLDVFGFSRGAAEARVFCNWLSEILQDGKLAGVQIHLRFLGLMDTVASAGFVSSGHSGWAEPEFLRIPNIVKNCVHMVAMHELRKNFPLDEIGANGALPKCWQQFAYPGSHSDVGGGYQPGELGISVGRTPGESDWLKLSQIPLNHMLECALAAGAPMNKKLAPPKTNGHDPFAIAPQVQQAFNQFIAVSQNEPRAVHQWLQPYLNWRWQVRNHFDTLNHVKKASRNDQSLLLRHNNFLRAFGRLLNENAEAGAWRKALNFAFGPPSEKLKRAALVLLDPEAGHVLKTAQSARATPPALAAFFDGFVHDSLAGFDRPAIETAGYWRYRKGFTGDDSARIVSNEDIEGASKIA